MSAKQDWSSTCLRRANLPQLLRHKHNKSTVNFQVQLRTSEEDGDADNTQTVYLPTDMAFAHIDEVPKTMRIALQTSPNSSKAEATG